MQTESSHIAQKLRKGDAPEDAVPCCMCICQPKGVQLCSVSWLFRHDVVDGWRSLRYLFLLAFEDKQVTFERLRSDHERHGKLGKRGKRGKRGKLDSNGSNGSPSNLLLKAGMEAHRAACMATRAVGCAIATATLTAALSPLALYRIVHISSASRSPPKCKSKQFYAHVVCDIHTLKQIGKREGTRTLTSTLSSCMLRAYFAADRTPTRANVANAVLFNPDSPHGNHMCMKVCSISRKRGTDASKTDRSLSSASQKLADKWVVCVSRAYALGKLPKAVGRGIDRAQKQVDFLISSLPGTDSSEPGVEDLHVCREFSSWTPSITYCIGINGTLYMDFYWEVRESFDDACFLTSFCDAVCARRSHTDLPSMY